MERSSMAGSDRGSVTQQLVRVAVFEINIDGEASSSDQDSGETRLTQAALGLALRCPPPSC